MTVRGNADIQSTEHLDSGQPSNHLPDLLGDLAHTRGDTLLSTVTQ